MKIHLGCGQVYIPGYIHVDAVKHDHVDIVAQADDLSMFDDESVELIYASHILEHINRHSIERVLREWNRILKIEGVLRIAVPDFESIVRVYIENGRLEDLIGLLYGGQDDQYNIHHYCFDFRLLEKHMNNSGFCNVNRYDWKLTEHQEYDDYSQAYLPHMDKINGTLMSLNVEGYKCK